MDSLIDDWLISSSNMWNNQNVLMYHQTNWLIWCTIRKHGRLWSISMEGWVRIVWIHNQPVSLNLLMKMLFYCNQSLNLLTNLTLTNKLASRMLIHANSLVAPSLPHETGGTIKLWLAQSQECPRILSKGERFGATRASIKGVVKPNLFILQLSCEFSL